MVDSYIDRPLNRCTFFYPKIFLPKTQPIFFTQETELIKSRNKKQETKNKLIKLNIKNQNTKMQSNTQQIIMDLTQEDIHNEGINLFDDEDEDVVEVNPFVHPFGEDEAEVDENDDEFSVGDNEGDNEPTENEPDGLIHGGPAPKGSDQFYEVAITRNFAFTVYPNQMETEESRQAALSARMDWIRSHLENNHYANEKLGKPWRQIVEFCKWCLETAPTTRTPHLHAYVRFADSKKYRFTTLQKMFPGAFLEKVQSSEAWCKYLEKDWKKTGVKNVSSFGTQKAKQPGKRNDLLDAIKTLKANNGSIHNSWRGHEAVYAKFGNGMKNLAFLMAQSGELDDGTPRTYEKEVIWIYGKSGLGKSWFVADACGLIDRRDPEHPKVLNKPHILWRAPSSGTWYDGYDVQENALFDDWNVKSRDWKDVLRLLDNQPYNVQVKGSYASWNPKKVFITHLYPPWEVYADGALRNGGEDMYQLERRVTKIIHFTGKQEWHEVPWGYQPPVDEYFNN